MLKKTEMQHVRLTKEEVIAFTNFANKIGVKRSRLMRKMIRETINGTPDLLTDEEGLFKIAIRQLIGVAHNLNQITKAIHSGEIIRTIDFALLNDVKNRALTLKLELDSHIKKTKKRWVKNG